MVMPCVCLRSTVHRTALPMTMVPVVARKTPAIHRSGPAPGEWALSASGG